MRFVAVLVVTALALPLIATAAIYISSRGTRGEAGTAPLPLWAAAGAFTVEWLATLAFVLAAVLPVRQPGAAARSRRIALLLPELYGSSAAFWYLRRCLRAAGWDSAVVVQRMHGRRTEELFAALDAHVAQLPSGRELVLVGHGVGGLLAYRYAQQRPVLRVRHVVTLATPHQGSHALPYRLLGDGALALPAPTPSEAAAPDVIAIYSDFDAWLVPVDDAYCPGGFNIAVRGVGHCAVLLSRRVADLIVENLSAPPPGDRLPTAS